MSDELSTVDASATDPASTQDSPVVEGQAVQQTDQSFLSDEAIMDKIRATPELDHTFKQMQASFTKRMQGIAKYREAASTVDRFNSDPEFARQIIQQRAGQLGIQLGQSGQSQPGLQNGTAQNVPPQLVEAVKSHLSPELQWMAPALAASQWAGMQMALQPIHQQQAQTQQSTRDQEYDTLAQQLSGKNPGWEQHEEDMDALLTFMQSPKMSDRRFGSKLELLHKLIVGSGQATAEAARRMGQAALSRNPAGAPMASQAPNIAEQVRKPKSNQDAWDIAAKHAISELGRQGIKVS